MQCPRFLFGAKGASTDVEYQGIRQRLAFQCNETKTSRAAGRRSPWSPRRRIASAFGSRRPTLVRITCTRCSLRNGRCWRPPRSIFGKRTRASINRTSHHRGEDGLIKYSLDREVTELIQAVHRASSRTPLARQFFLCIVHHQPLRQSTIPHTGVGYYTTTVARTSINLVSLVFFIV